MTTVEDRLTDAAATLRREVDVSVDVETALTRAVDPAPTRSLSRLDGRSQRPWGPFLVAAAVLAVAVVAGAVFMTDDEDPVVSEEGVASSSTELPSSVPGTGDLPFRLLGTVPDSSARGGTITYAGIEDAYVDQWSSVTEDLLPPVDFDREVVMTLTLTERDGCPIRLIELDRDDDLVRPQLSVGGGEDCGPAVVARTFVVAIDRADLPSRFTVVIPAAPDDGYPEQRLDVDLSQNAASHVPPVLVGDGPVVGGTDLQAPAPGREITFEGMGDVLLGQVLDPSEVTQFEGAGPCGYWGPPEPSHDGDEPPSGLVSGADGPSPRVWTIKVGRNSIYRTASGVGVGTTLATLERIYGDRLVVDRADQEQTPTDGLVGWYQDVAAVRYGDNALTFYLSGDAVSTVKLSPADFWGDDEGCA